jgi:acyl-homoserine lactone synthase
MIYVVSGQDAGRYSTLMDQVYRLRHRVFAEELGRFDLASAEGLERDQFERPDAVHHIWSRAGKVAGYLRLLPTVGPHVPSSISANTCSGRFPRGLDTYELTRYCVAREWRDEGCGIGSELIAGLAEWGLACRVNKVIAEMETAWLFRAMQLKFKVSALHAQLAAGKERMAMLIEFDASVLEAIRAYRKHWDRVVSFLGEHEAKRPAMTV